MTPVPAGQPLTSTRSRRLTVLLGHAFVGWGLCDLAMVVGMAVASLGTALMVHAIGAPIFFAVVSWNYFKRFGYTTPLQTAITFVSFVIVVDFFLVALVIERSFEMFTSPLGTWIPFVLIFGSTYLTGREVERRHGPAAEHRQ
jgi:hypothetical protein